MQKAFRLLLSSNYFNTIAFGVLGPLYALFVADLGGSAFHAGFSWTTYALTAGLLMMAVGKLEDTFSNRSRYLLSGSHLIIALASFSYIFVSELWQLYVVQIVFGVGVAIMTPVSKTTFTAMEAKGHEAQGWALLDGGNFIILAIASSIGGTLVALGSFTILFLFMGFAQLGSALLSHVALRP